MFRTSIVNKGTSGIFGLVDFDDTEVLDLLVKLKQIYPTVRFIAHSSVDDTGLVNLLLKIGFDAYLLWGSDVNDFKNAFEAIGKGKKIFKFGFERLLLK